MPLHAQKIPTSSKGPGILRRRGNQEPSWEGIDGCQTHHHLQKVGGEPLFQDQPPPKGTFQDLPSMQIQCLPEVGIWSTLRRASQRLSSPGCQGSQKDPCLPCLRFPGLNPAAAEKACQPVSLASGSVEHGTHHRRRGRGAEPQGRGPSSETLH